MWPLEYDQHLLRLIKGAPLRVGACHMGPQSSIGATLSVQQKREVVRQGCTILLSDQGSKAIFPHECMQHSNIIFTKGFWDIHSSPKPRQDALRLQTGGGMARSLLGQGVGFPLAVNLATDSEGQTFSGEQVERN